MKKDENTPDRFNRNILVAVDESDNSRRAVSYVGQMLGGVDGFSVMLLHVINEPDEDFFQTADEKDRWLEQKKRKSDARLADYKSMLVQAGFAEASVSTRSTLRYCPSMAQCILSEREEEAFSTIVVGRQGLSRSEEFLFGSISSKIVNHAKNCTVWVVE